jgi:hypothetical protein
MRFSIFFSHSHETRLARKNRQENDQKRMNPHDPAGFGVAREAIPARSPISRLFRLVYAMAESADKKNGYALSSIFFVEVGEGKEEYREI